MSAYRIALHIVWMFVFLYFPTVFTVGQSDTYLPIAVYQPLRFVCDVDAYACADFKSQGEAQEIFAYCQAKVGRDIHLLDANGDNFACKATLPVVLATGHTPRWSPNGDRIAFLGRSNDIEDIIVMNAGGSNQLPLHAQPAEESGLSWSPTANRLVFERIEDGDREIFAINADGSDLTQLTSLPGPDRVHSWSPDGKKITFERLGTEQSDLFVMDADGENATRLTGIYGKSTWSPDSKKNRLRQSGSRYLCD